MVSSNKGKVVLNMTTNMESVYWMRNEEWYKITEKGFILTEKAPERARKSFELYKKINKIRNIEVKQI